MAIPEDMTEGSEFETLSYGKLKVIEYINKMEIVVEFIDTKYRTATQAVHIRTGRVKDKLKPSVYGVGYVGVGSHESAIKRKLTRPYVIWKAMLARCYSGRETHKSYRDCEVAKEWHNFQSFADWYEQNHPKNGFNYHLDKDIKVKGNRVYGPDLCTFVTIEENSSVMHGEVYGAVSITGKTTYFSNKSAFMRGNNISRDLIEASIKNRGMIKIGFMVVKIKTPS